MYLSQKEKKRHPEYEQYIALFEETITQMESGARGRGAPEAIIERCLDKALEFYDADSAALVETNLDLGYGVCVLMKVKPIPTSFKKNEIRVIRIGEKAINELMWEALMENKSEWFNVQDCAEDIVFLMQWDKSKNQLTYIAVQDGFLSKEGLFHFRKLRKCPITTDSLFAKRRYRQLRLR